MKLYNIDTDYVNYLRTFNSIVLDVNNGKEKRPFIGVVLSINNCDYFAPLTHIQKQKNIFTDFNIFDKNNNSLGAIKLNNMIPVYKKKYVSEMEIKINNKDSINDIKYKKMLKAQLNYIDNNENVLNKKVNRMYKIGIGKDRKSFINDFKLLEEKCKLYIPEFYIYQDKEQGKLIVFTEEKTEDRYNLYGTIEVPKDQIGIIRDAIQLSDKTTFALRDENGKNKSFYSTLSNIVYETIEKLNEDVQCISQ